jgi:hypothetical protein
MKAIQCGACKGAHQTVQEVFSCHNTLGVFKLQEEDFLAAEMPKREFVKRNETNNKQDNAQRNVRKGNNMKQEHKVTPFPGIIKCEACEGTGRWPTLQNPNGIHFACKGSGRLKEMSEKQYSFIRELFMKMVVLGIISEDEQRELTKVMLAHKQAVTFQTSRWASNKIDEYKSRINRHKSSKIKARMNTEIVFDTPEEQDRYDSAHQETQEETREEEVW